MASKTTTKRGVKQASAKSPCPVPEGHDAHKALDEVRKAIAAMEKAFEHMGEARHHSQYTQHAAKFSMLMTAMYIYNQHWEMRSLACLLFPEEPQDPLF